MNENAQTPRSYGGRAKEIFLQQQDRVFRQTDRIFAVLMGVQWAVAIVVAVVWSPLAWEGKQSAVHAHVYAAVLLGGLISSFPIALTVFQPGAAITRHVVACAQMLWSALFIHLSGGRIETHFHVFGSLAFIAFYRDWKPLVPATIVVASDHLLRQLFWPESVYGITTPEWWRFVEHAGWVVFEDVILVISCLRGTQEMWTIALHQAELEALSESELRKKSTELSKALGELQRSQEQLVRAEKLAAVGQLAASVGHELRNPLMAIRNAASYLEKRVLKPAPDAAPLKGDARVAQFFEILDREVKVSNKIVTDLLDFARERTPVLVPCPVRALVTEALSVVQTGGRSVTIKNEVPEDLPVPSLDRDQFRQVVVNLVQNAVEAVPPERQGSVVIRAEGATESRPLRLSIQDDGAGIVPEARAKLFQPLFTTKTKGTGLGLAIADSVVRRHGGKIQVESEVGRGTTFTIEVPASGAPAPAAALVAGGVS